MKDLVIVGAGGFGRELLQWVKDVNKVEAQWNVLGFIDDNVKALDGIECEMRIISTIEDYVPEPDCKLALAIANPEIKEKVVSKLKARGASFATIIHPTAVVGDYNSFGEGVVMYPRSEITVNVKIGSFVTILSSSIGHDAVIEDYTTISSWCDITGGDHLGKKVYLAAGVKIIPGRKIGDGAYIGVGSIVMNNVKPGMKMLGYPAKKFMIQGR